MDNFFDLQNFQPPTDLDFPVFENFDSADADASFSAKQYHEEFILDGKKSHRCTFPDCGKIFKFKSEISRHLVIHFTDRPYTCPHESCQKAFKRADALENHLRIHTQDLPFPCEHPGCGLRFVTKAALRYHLLKHNNERTYRCTFQGCNKSFLTKTQLKQHEKAENYHLKVAAIHNVATVEHVEPVKKVKTDMVSTKDPCANIGPAPRLAKSLAWETKNAEVVEEPAVPVKPSGNGNLEGMLRQMIEENRMLKEKLEVCTRIMDVFQENQQLKSTLPKSVEPFPQFDFGFERREQEPTFTSYDGNEFNFLNF